MTSSIKQHDGIWILTVYTDLSGTWEYKFKTNRAATLMYRWLAHGCIPSSRLLERELCMIENPALWRGERIDK